MWSSREQPPEQEKPRHGKRNKKESRKRKRERSSSTSGEKSRNNKRLHQSKYSDNSPKKGSKENEEASNLSSKWDHDGFSELYPDLLSTKNELKLPQTYKKKKKKDKKRKHKRSRSKLRNCSSDKEIWVEKTTR